MTKEHRIYLFLSSVMVDLTVVTARSNTPSEIRYLACGSPEKQFLEPEIHLLAESGDDEQVWALKQGI